MIRERLPGGQYACATDMATRSRRANQSTIVRNLTIAKEAADGISINVYICVQYIDFHHRTCRVKPRRRDERCGGQS